MATQTILVVDDEDDLRKVLEFNLRNAGFQTLGAANGLTAIQLAQAEIPDLILLDVMLPDVQGTQVCQMLKTNPLTRAIPIVMLTARGEEIDRVVGFELGVDDYIVKPFSVREVVLRVRAILKRSERQSGLDEKSEPEIESGNLMRFGRIEFDPVRHRVKIDGEEAKLTATEFRLLETFLTRRGRVQTREMLLGDVWGEEINVTPRTVDTHVKRLREKLGVCGEYVETVRGVGYRFAEEP